MDGKNLKEQFIIELMVFSPKYNVVRAEQVAGQMTEVQIAEAYEKLSKINQAREEELSVLEEKDPAAYEEKLTAREVQEEKEDEIFFEKMEADMVIDTDAEDHRTEDVEKQMDLLAKDAEEKIDAKYDIAEDLLKNLFEEINSATTQPS